MQIQISEMSRYYNQSRSQLPRMGETKYEDYIEECFMKLGLECKRRQAFCFICLNMWENDSFPQYPRECRNCGTTYNERRMFSCPDIVLEDPGRHGKAVIYVNGDKYHTKNKDVMRDKFQISVLKKNNWRVFVINNEELDLLRHSNRCFLALGIYRAMLDKQMYDRAYINEKEIPSLK